VGGVYFGSARRLALAPPLTLSAKTDWLAHDSQSGALWCALCFRGHHYAVHGEVGLANQGTDTTSHFGDLEKRNVLRPFPCSVILNSRAGGVALGARIQGKTYCRYDLHRRRRAVHWSDVEGLNFRRRAESWIV